MKSESQNIKTDYPAISLAIQFLGKSMTYLHRHLIIFQPLARVIHISPHLELHES